jgi:hypothetical protein
MSIPNNPITTVKLPWFRKTNFLAQTYNLPTTVTQSIVFFHRMGYRFTNRFLRALAVDAAMQSVFTDRSTTALPSSNLPEPPVEISPQKSRYLITIQKFVFDIKEKPAKPHLFLVP